MSIAHFTKALRASLLNQTKPIYVVKVTDDNTKKKLNTLPTFDGDTNIVSRSYNTIISNNLDSLNRFMDIEVESTSSESVEYALTVRDYIALKKNKLSGRIHLKSDVPIAILPRKDLINSYLDNTAKEIGNQIDLLFLTNKGAVKKTSKVYSEKVSRKVIHATEKAETNNVELLKQLLQPFVTLAVGKDMDAADYFRTRTGRFTKSVSILDIEQAKNHIDVKYNYRKNPYVAFEQGHSHHRPGREPTKIIQESIRSAAAKIIGSKFKVRPRQ